MLASLDDTLYPGPDQTTLRALHAAGRLRPGTIDHRLVDDWSPGGDTFYVQDARSGDMWQVTETVYRALFPD